MSVILGVAAGGALGALSRYGVDTFVERRTDSVFPWATFLINVSGCLAVGFLIAARSSPPRAAVAPRRPRARLLRRLHDVLDLRAGGARCASTAAARAASLFIRAIAETHFPKAFALLAFVPYSARNASAPISVRSCGARLGRVQPAVVGGVRRVRRSRRRAVHRMFRTSTVCSLSSNAQPESTTSEMPVTW